MSFTTICNVQLKPGSSQMFSNSLTLALFLTNPWPPQCEYLFEVFYLKKQFLLRESDNSFILALELAALFERYLGAGGIERQERTGTNSNYVDIPIFCRWVRYGRVFQIPSHVNPQSSMISLRPCRVPLPSCVAISFFFPQLPFFFSQARKSQVLQSAFGLSRLYSSCIAFALISTAPSTLISQVFR